jgi:hypothetical protein
LDDPQGAAVGRRAQKELLDGPPVLLDEKRVVHLLWTTPGPLVQRAVRIGDGKEDGMRLPCIGVLALAALAGCRAAEPEHEARVRWISAHTSYDHQGAELNRNAHIPEHDPAEMVPLFDEHKGQIVGALAPYLRTYDGGDYPGIAVSIYGKPVPPDGATVVFHVSVDATLAPREGSGTRPLLDDSYLGHVLFDVAEKSVTSAELSGSQLHSVPERVLVRASALVREWDSRFSRPVKGQVRWLPRWYVVEQVLPRIRAGEGVAGEYRVIKEEPEGHVVLLSFLLPGGSSSRDERPMHVVVLDMGAERILGVHETTVDLGPVYRER